MSLWKCKTYEFDDRTPHVMGILNVTPDSFSDGGDHNKPACAIEFAHQMIEAGAEIIDVGGESTRPGSDEVPIEEEIERTFEVVRELAEDNICVSIDTRHAPVAKAALEAGAAIINDVSGFRDPAMVEVARSCDAGLVVMHMKGEPKTMHHNPEYEDMVAEVCAYLRDRAHELENAGIDRTRICLDPGPGFGKNGEQNIELMRNCHEFVRLGYPIMVAVSRKAFLGKVYHIPEAKDRDQVSATESLLACELGASIVRIHNVPTMMEELKKLRPYAVIALGSNQALNEGEKTGEAEKIAVLNQALSELALLPDSDLVDVSSFYESEPAYVEDQDTFINAVALLRTGLPPRELLDYLHVIENSLGRVRSVQNGPRTCDLDIIDYQLYVSNADEELILPHPRALERDFIVKPLAEIRPQYVFADDTPLTFDQVRVGKATKIAS